MKLVKFACVLALTAILWTFVLFRARWFAPTQSSPWSRPISIHRTLAPPGTT